MKEYKPNPVNTDDIKLSDDLLELTEKIAEMSMMSGQWDASTKDGDMARKRTWERSFTRIWFLMTNCLNRRKSTTEIRHWRP